MYSYRVTIIQLIYQHLVLLDAKLIVWASTGNPTTRLNWVRSILYYTINHKDSVLKSAYHQKG